LNNPVPILIGIPIMMHSLTPARRSGEVKELEEDAPHALTADCVFLAVVRRFVKVVGCLLKLRRK
jgi:hypothetical protein